MKPHANRKATSFNSEQLLAALAELQDQLSLPPTWDVSLLSACRSDDLSEFQLRGLMIQYFHYVHRFANWLSLIVANTTDDDIRGPLIPNLVDEISDSSTHSSHRALLVNLLDAIGVAPEELYKSEATSATATCAKHFWTTYSRRHALLGLFALGPGTEAVSWCFLNPMESAIRSVFSPTRASLLYFEVHRQEHERAHVESIDHAIATALSKLPAGDRSEFWHRGKHVAHNAVRTHQRFFSQPLPGLAL